MKSSLENHEQITLSAPLSRAHWVWVTQWNLLHAHVHSSTSFRANHFSNKTLFHLILFSIMKFHSLAGHINRPSWRWSGEIQSFFNAWTILSSSSSFLSWLLHMQTHIHNAWEELEQLARRERFQFSSLYIPPPSLDVENRSQVKATIWARAVGTGGFKESKQMRVGIRYELSRLTEYIFIWI